MGAEIFPDIDALVDGDLLMHRHAAQGDHAVHVAVNGDNLVSLVQIGDEELVADLIGGVTLEIALIAGIADIHTAGKPPFSLAERSAGQARRLFISILL